MHVSYARPLSLLSCLCASTRLVSSRAAKFGRSAGLAAVLLAAGGGSLQMANADGNTRTLSFHNVHTGEDLTVTFKRNGRYDEAALKRINWFLRDWRRGEEVKMDPHLFDLLWDAYKATGASEPINVICGYRSPQTNSMLRARSRGVAQGSLHTHGQALDFFIPGVPLEKIREVGLKMQAGGVGFYPTSGSPFVHLDTGTIRHWPRMTRDQLVKVFPNQRTVHIPADGKPLDGYALALVDVERQGRAPSNVSLAAAQSSGVSDDDDVVTASAKADKTDKPKAPTLLASFFGFKAGAPDKAESKTSTDTKTDTKTDTRANDRVPAAPVRVQTASLTAPTPVAVERIVPMPKTRPDIHMAVASLTPVTPMPRMRPAAAPVAVAARDLFAERGLWASIAQDQANQLADQWADRITTASSGPALSYASQAAPTAKPARHAPMGASARKVETAALAPVHAAAAPTSATLRQIGQHFDYPWMRAVIMTPSARGFMSTAQMVRRDNRVLRDLIHKPDSAVLMAFSDDPHGGITSDRFSGHAVSFPATATFRLRATAALTY